MKFKKGLICNVYQDGKATFLGMCTGNMLDDGYEFVNLETLELVSVDVEFEVGNERANLNIFDRFNL